MIKNASFNKENFHFDGMYLVYGPYMYSKDSRFVARFKYSRRDKASFIKFLIANFTVEEYFGALEKQHAPTEILKAKGWVSPTVLKAKAAMAA